MKEGQDIVPSVLETPKPSGVRGRRRHTHFTNPRKLKAAQKRRKERELLERGQDLSLSLNSGSVGGLMVVEEEEKEGAITETEASKVTQLLIPLLYLAGQSSLTSFP